MKYTFEITICGCSTNCAHCYVDGGAAPQISLSSYEVLLEKLKPVLDRVEGDISVTLGNEIFCHSRIAELLKITAEYIPEYYSYDGGTVPTTGIALLANRDREQILETLKTVNSRGFMLAVHGAEQVHNEIVQRNGAFSKLFEAADYFADNGLELLFNFIVSKPLCEGFEQIMRRVSKYSKAGVVLAVPLYVPTNRMRKYQRLRAEFDDCIHLADAAKRYGIDASSLYKHCVEHNEKTVIEWLEKEGFSYKRAKNNAIQWKFFNITQNGDIFYGNVGAHTKYIGNLIDISTDRLLEEIVSSVPNYDYVAYYPEEAFYAVDKHIACLPERTHNYVYKSNEECIYALLDEAGVQNALI